MGVPPLIAAKLVVPSVPRGFVHRPRLDRRLDEGLSAAATTVLAPAGSGKSTLVAAWTGAHGATIDRAWINADERDTSAGVLHHLAAAVGADVDAPDVHGALRAALQGERARPLVLVVDDVHLVRSDGVVDALRWVSDIAADLHLVLVGRAGHLPARWGLAREQLVELAAPDLLLTVDEADAIVRRRAADLPASVRSGLVGRVDGWVAGLQLALDRVAAIEDPADTATAFGAGSATLADYLADEVLGQLDPDHRAVLTVASVLDEWSAEGCRAVTGRDDAFALLTGLAEDNLLVGRPVDGAYRCHPYLLALLRARLRDDDEQRYRRLQRVVAHTAEQRGDLVGAVTHLAEAQAPRDLLDMCRRHALQLATSGAGPELRRWLAGLRAPAFADLEDELAAAEVQLRAGDAAGCARRIERCQPGTRPSHRAPVAALRGRCHHQLGDPVEALRSAREARVLLVSAGIALPGRTPASVCCDEAFGLLWEGRLTRAALSVAAAEGDDLAVGLAARIAAESADLGTAERLARSVLGPPGPRPPTDTQVVHALVARAQVLVERAEDVTTAVRAVDELVAAAERAGTMDALVVAGELQARLRWTGIGVAAGLGALDRVQQRGWSRPLAPPLQARLARIEARLRIEAGEPEEVEALLVGLHDPLSEVLRARVAARRGHVGEALARLDRVRADEPDVVGEVARARLRVLADDGSPRAVGAAGGLLALEASRCQVRRLLEEGEGVRTAIAAVPGSGRVASLLDRLHRATTATVLSERELAILRYLPTRLTNQEIGGQLFISTNTVKTHLKNLYRRLGVSRREEAVQRARDLGLLDEARIDRHALPAVAG